MLELKLQVDQEQAIYNFNVPENFTSGQLLQAIATRFNELDAISNYQLRTTHNNHILDANKPLSAFDIVQDDLLHLVRIHTVTPNRIQNEASSVFIMESRTKKRFSLFDYPSIIGRSRNRNNLSLSINLFEFPNSEKISRQHAQISKQNQSFFIRLISKRNHLSLNGHPLEYNQDYQIGLYDRIDLGLSQLRFTFYC